MMHRMISKALISKAMFLALAWMAVPALAQDIDAEGALLEGDPQLEGGLQERQVPDKVEVEDPAPKLLQEVEEARKAFEARLNGAQGLAAKFLDLNEALGKVTGAFLKAQEAYLESHLKAMDAFNKAVEAKDAKAQKEQRRVVIKLRKDYLKGVKKANQAADKFDKDAEKIKKQAAVEEAEAAAGEGTE